MQNEKDSTPNPLDQPSPTPKSKKKEKTSVDPAQRGPGGFNKSILKGKKPIFMKLKKSGR